MPTLCQIRQKGSREFRSTLSEKPTSLTANRFSCTGRAAIPACSRSFLLYFDRVDVSGSVHVRAKHNPLRVGSEGCVGLETVIVAGKINQSLHFQLVILRPEEIDPLAVPGGGNAAGSTAVTRKELSIRGHVVVDRPVLPLDPVPDLPIRSHDRACQPELLAFGSLLVVPDCLSIVAEELVSGDLHVHGSDVNLLQP